VTSRMEEAGVKETARLEAFSDGVFAIAITLLVLELKVPHASELRQSGRRLTGALLHQWPSFLAYITSFATILVMWVNHHRLFTYIRRTNPLFLYLNGLLLLFVTFVPFPTALVAEHIEEPEARTAAAVYAGTYVAIAIVFNVLWRYAASGRRLLDSGASAAEIEAITGQYRIGPAMYLAAFALAFFSVAASVGLCLGLALYFAFTGSLLRVFRRERA
jgi:TMEM175 potassium channel family protein